MQKEKSLEPVSSLDDNSAIAIASDLAKLLKGGAHKIKTVISSHHGSLLSSNEDTGSSI
jgi:hypothetical protein